LWISSFVMWFWFYLLLFQCTNKVWFDFVCLRSLFLRNISSIAFVKEAFFLRNISSIAFVREAFTFVRLRLFLRLFLFGMTFSFLSSHFRARRVLGPKILREKWIRLCLCLRDWRSPQPACPGRSTSERNLKFLSSSVKLYLKLKWIMN